MTRTGRSLILSALIVDVLVDRRRVEQPPSDVRSRLLSRLAATLVTLSNERPQTWRLCEAVRRLLGADGAVITVEYLSESRTTICATDAVVEELEGLQEVLGEGPSYEAARDGAAVVADLYGPDGRWPMLMHALSGKHSSLRVFAVPLNADGGLSGVATLYTLGAELSEPMENTTFLLNAVGAALVVDAHEHKTTDDIFTGAWSSRAVIHQATGMVVAQLRLPPEDALTLIRGHAYALAIELHEVAEQIVGREINFSGFEVEGE